MLHVCQSIKRNVVISDKSFNRLLAYLSNRVPGYSDNFTWMSHIYYWTSFTIHRDMKSSITTILTIIYCSRYQVFLFNSDTWLLQSRKITDCYFLLLFATSFQIMFQLQMIKSICSPTHISFNIHIIYIPRIFNRPFF